MENWKDIIGYENHYQVSDMGRVKSLKRMIITGYEMNHLRMISTKILKPRINFNYYIINLWKNNICKTYRINRLVALAFIPNPLNLPEVNHLDCDKTNNNDWNLEWCTQLENKQHAVNNDLYLSLSGENHYLSKLTENQIKEIRAKYIPWKYTIYKLAEEYQVTFQTIHKIIKRKTWKHIL